MRRTLYWKRLLIVVAVFLAIGGAVFGVHRVQVKNQVSIFKTKAEQAESGIGGDAAKRGEVLDLYAKYLKFRPSDEAAYQRYAALLFEQGKADREAAPPARVTSGVEGFLRAFPAHADERRQLAEVYLDAGKHMNAKQHVEMLFGAPGGAAKTDIALLELAAECELGLGNLPGAAKHLNDAIATNKAPVRVYRRALEVNHSNTADPRRNAAVASLLDALLRDPRFVNDLTARVAAAQFQRFLGETQNARDNITYALTKIPGGDDDPDARLAAAELTVAEIKTLAQGPEKLREAEAHLRIAHARGPKKLAAGALLAEVLARQDKRDEGIAVLRGVAKQVPRSDPDYAMVIDRLIDMGESTDSAAMTDALPEEAGKNLGAYFRGRLAVLKQDWQLAQRLLEEAGPKVAAVRIFHKKAMTGLAACYATMQNPDRQLYYCERALAADPNFPPALIGRAEALARLPGRGEEALRQYRALVNTFQLVDYRPELVRLELLDVLAQPVEAELRNWNRFDESLGVPAKAGAAELLALRPELLVLYADSLTARGRPADATALLREWLDKNPGNGRAAGVSVALARLSPTREAALAALDDAQARAGDLIDVRLARAGLLAGQAKPPTAADFDRLAADAAKLPERDRFRLWYGLGTAAARAADLQKGDNEASKALRAAAIRHLRAAADLMPKDLMCRAALLDHGLAGGRTDVVDQALKEMADVEGKDGPFGALGQIAVKLPAVRATADAAQRAAAVRELRALAERVRESRPGWGRVYVALAELDATEGLNDAALANYSQAIEKGERQEYVIRRAVDLYRTRKQDDKAVGLLNKLSTEVRLPDDLERYRAIRDLLRSPELPKNSRATVDRIAPADSKDYRMQLLRGSLLVTIRADEDGMAAFRRAVELNDQSADTWASLVAQLVRANKPDDARRAVAQAEKALTAKPPATKEAAAELRLALGGLHELVGDTAAALGHFAAAAAAAPLELNPVRQLILFHQRSGLLAKGDELLNRAKESPAPDLARWARRHLALTLMSQGDAYNRRAEALALVERNLATAPDDAEDVKVRAVVWTVDPATREEGVRVLKSYGGRGDLTPDEFYLLGRLAFDQGKYGDAEQWFKLAAQLRPGVTAEHLAALVRVYVALNRLDLADGALERLKLNNPNSWDPVREEARLLYRKSRDRTAVGERDAAQKLLDQARDLIHKFPKWDEGDNVPARSGPLLEELGLTADAVAVYQKHLAGNKDPGAHASLAVLYIRQRQPERAIDLAFAREDKAPPLLTARLLTGAVRAKRPDVLVEAKVEKWLAAALAQAGRDPELEAALIGAKAELHDARGEYDAAVKEYERSIAAFDRLANGRGRKDLVVNNLSMLLALRQPELKRADDAVKMMSELIGVRGPVPSFLDTRAVAYLVSGRPDQAVKDLEMALVQYDRAVYHFHLAWAYDLNQLDAKRILAVDELKAAKRLGLTAADLHPIEFEKYQLLLSKYKLPLD